MTRKLAFALVLVLCACGGDDDGALSSFDSYVNAFGRAVDAACACSQDPTACEAEVGFTAAEVSCLRDIISENEAAVEGTIDCFAAAANTQANCLEGIECTDTAGAQDCFAAFESSTDACPELPEGIDEMFDACFPE